MFFSWNHDSVKKKKANNAWNGKKPTAKSEDDKEIKEPADEHKTNQN
jgi:hypothetical protein